MAANEIENEIEKIPSAREEQNEVEKIPSAREEQDLHSVDNEEDDGTNEPGPFALPVDPDQQYKAKELKFWSFARPHMRAFHYSWMAMFMGSILLYGMNALLPEI